jgi:hydroxymethylpyrimidine pyrophosphatase-like HAD family hydrolase
VGRSAAPANATAEVKAAVHYVSACEDGAGVVDILTRWCSPLSAAELEQAACEP